MSIYNHYPFKIGGRSLKVSYRLDVFQGGGLIIVKFNLFFKVLSNCQLSF